MLIFSLLRGRGLCIIKIFSLIALSCLAVAQYGFHVSYGPVGERLHGFEHLYAACGERIFHPWRNFWIGRTVHNAVFFQRLERRRQHFRCGVAYGVAQFCEAHRRLLRQCVQHQHRPFVAYACQYVPYRTVGIYGITSVIFHIFVSGCCAKIAFSL